MPDIRRYEMLLRLKEFGATHPDLFPEASCGARLFTALGAVVDDLQSHLVAQAAGRNATRQGTSAKDTARGRLRAALKTLARAMQLLAAGAPARDGAFRLPKSRSDQRLVAAARASVQLARPLRDQIIADDLPTTVLDGVTAAADAFEAAATVHSQARESRTAARADISATMTKALRIAAKLDVVIETQCKDDAGMLAAWQSARHVSNVTVRHANPQQSAPPVIQAVSAMAA